MDSFKFSGSFECDLDAPVIMSGATLVEGEEVVRLILAHDSNDLILATIFFDGHFETEKIEYFKEGVEKFLQAIFLSGTVVRAMFDIAKDGNEVCGI